MSNAQAKVAIVTGSSREIGAAIAERLAVEGFTVVINYVGRAADAEAPAGRIERAGGHAITVPADVCHGAAVSPMFDMADAAFGYVDVPVNNAGSCGWRAWPTAERRQSPNSSRSISSAISASSAWLLSPRLNHQFINERRS